MSFIYRNWTVHNLVGHPLSEVSYLFSVPFVGKSKAEDISGWIHDATLPLKNTAQGRGQMKKELHQAINNAIMKEFMFQGYNKHQALHAILELTEEPEQLRETLHGALDKYIDYKKSYRIEL